MKISLFFSTSSTKSAFSDKRPYPGWIALALYFLQILIMAKIFIYVSETLDPGIFAASSAKLTCIELTSSSE